MATTDRQAATLGTGSDGPLILAQFFPSWHRRAACVGLGVARWYADTGGDGQGQGDHARAAKKICAGCPVAAVCLDAALEQHEMWGVWGGAGEAERRTFARARPARPHGPDPLEGCACRWCQEWERHRSNLDAIATGGRRAGRHGDRNGPGATHGRRATYARGCRCSPCRWSASQLGQDLARAGLSTVDHFAAYCPEGAASWEVAKAAVDYAARVALEALESDAGSQSGSQVGSHPPEQSRPTVDA